jgi:hypothetical protein
MSLLVVARTENLLTPPRKHRLGAEVGTGCRQPFSGRQVRLTSLVHSHDSLCFPQHSATRCPTAARVPTHRGSPVGEACLCHRQPHYTACRAWFPYRLTVVLSRANLKSWLQM